LGLPLKAQIFNELWLLADLIAAGHALLQASGKRVSFTEVGDSGELGRNKGQHLNQHPLLRRGEFDLSSDNHIGEFEEGNVAGDRLRLLLRFDLIQNRRYSL
jgi:hypothetical protein